MKRKITLLFVTFTMMAGAFGQRSTFELTFTGVNNATYVQLDSIKVMNRSQGGDTVLYYPDTVLVLDYPVGITEVSHETTGLQVLQNYPNPVEDQTTILLYIPEKDKVDLMITDMIGRQLIHTGLLLDKGYHSFRFTPGIGNLFFFNACWQGQSSSIKVLHYASDLHRAGSLEYLGGNNSILQLKTTEAVQSFSFTPGDNLLYIGYSGALQSGMLDSPVTSEIFILQFATNIPCPGTPEVTYEGQVYNTIQIFNQCWLKENLNVGMMIPGTQEMNNNNVIEKYCYDDNTFNCDTYGGLYQWDEMMEYETTQGLQGICPQGWHLPTDEEWKVMEGAVDSHYGIGDLVWDGGDSHRGYNAGRNLKTISGWNVNGNGTDLYGFSGLPGGYRFNNSGNFSNIGNYGMWWQSTETSEYYAWHRTLYYNDTAIGRFESDRKGNGFSVSCIQDN